MEKKEEVKLDEVKNQLQSAILHKLEEAKNKQKELLDNLTANWKVLSSRLQDSFYKKHKAVEELAKKVSNEQGAAVKEAYRDSMRDLLPAVLDGAGIPHTDMAVVGNGIASGRYVISQWQRVAAGAIAFVFAYDEKGDLHVALGKQGKDKKLTPAQGFMEARISGANLTSLPADKSRYGKNNKGETVQIKADNDLYDNAIRETKEELGIEITRDQLIPLYTRSGSDTNYKSLQTVAESFVAILPKSVAEYKLEVKDLEFANADLQVPAWYKVKDLVIAQDGKAQIGNETLPFDDKGLLEKAIQKAGELKIASVSSGQYNSHDEVLQDYKIKLASVLGKELGEQKYNETAPKKPESLLGKDGQEYQRYVEEKAEQLAKRRALPKVEKQKNPLNKENIGSLGFSR